MDESWRCTMGSVLPRQRSSENHAGGGGGGGGGRQGLAPDDFRDVFGGPPRTVLLRSFYGETTADASYHQYHSPAMVGNQLYGGGADAFCRRRPCGGGDGRVPTEVGFFDDIFGAGRHVRSRSRSTTKSSSAVSSDEFGRPVASGCRGGDATLSSFASKLRPIAIPSRRYDLSPPSTASTRCDYQSTSFTCSTAAYPASRCYYAAGAGGNGRTTTNHSSAASGNAADNHRHNHHNRGGGFCCFTSNPATTSNGHSFRRGGGRRAATRSPAADDTATEAVWSHADDYGYYYSPPAPSSSAASSSVFGGNPMARRRLEEVVMEVRERAPLLMVDDDDGGDIDSVSAAAVDEAIAWAKERFWSQA